MNLILFDPAELDRPLLREDARARHLLEVLRCGAGVRFDAGVVNGPRGKGWITGEDATGLRLAFEWGAPPPPIDPIDLILGLPRPQTARRLLRELASLGVRRMDFVRTEKGEPSYAGSRLWSTGEWRRHLRDGVEQAFCTRLPAVEWGRALPEAVGGAPAGGIRLALDNYEAVVPLSRWRPEGWEGVRLAIGGERGWSGEERDLLRAAGYCLVGLGERVLRQETAALAAVVMVKVRLGWI
ncbi:MAG: RsmE family RNA methyltransferase [Puniceicoccaceae bacterium]|nr:MAG: RsmE family RNA methyltransferase [Puniceicoccaceae bacterium]